MMKSFWPQADLGEGVELKKLYRERLRNCRPELLELALKEVRANYSSRTPELKWILEKYRRLLREWNSNQNKPAPGTEKGQADLEMMKEIEEDRERIAFNLSLLEAHEIDILKEDIAQRAFLQSLVGRYNGPPDQWSHFQKGVAWALYTSLSSDQSRGPSPG